MGVFTSSLYRAAAVAALLTCALPMLAVSPCYGAEKGQAIVIERGEHQLLVDDYLIDSMQGAQRTWHQPEKHPRNPIVVPDAPGESISLLFGTVLRDDEDGLFKMWYLCDTPEGTGTGYATSKDGITWQKPKLGLFKVGGTKGNNVCLLDSARYYEIAGVLKNPIAKGPDEKFVMAIMGWQDGERCYHVMMSPDGMRWREVHHIVPPAPVKPDRACFVWDPRERKFALYARCKHIPDKIAAREGNYFWGRAVALIKSDDLENWSEPVVVMAPDVEDPVSCEIYSLMAWPYGGMWLGLAQTYYSEPTKASINVQFAFSRDGVNWTRQREKPFDAPFLPLGPPGQWDRFNNAVASRPVQVRDQLYIYYSGRTYRHGGYKGTDSGASWGAIGLATLRLDGFCSLDGSFDKAVVTTKPLNLPPGELRLNAACRFGSVVVEVLDEAGNAVDGYLSQPVEGDGTSLPVVFPGGKSLANVSTSPVRLRFTLKNARLFSFWIE
jgi:hypothetical protein